MDLSPYRWPEGEFAFHRTARENATSIRRDGLLRSATCNCNTEKISEALVSHGYESRFPFDRSDVVYCYLDETHVEEVSMIDWPGNDDIVIVVDLEQISAPLYLADMRLASDLLEHRMAPAAPTKTATFDQAVRQYKQSIVRVDCSNSIPKQASEIDGYAELIVDGDISPEAIVDV